MELEALGLKVTGVQDVNQAASALDGLAKSSDGANKSTQGLGKGAADASRNIDKAKQSSDVASRSIDSLGSAAKAAGGIFVAAFSIASLRDYADQWSDMRSQVGAATGDMSGAGDRMQRLVDIANASYAPLQQTIQAYAGNVAVLREMGKSTSEAADFTESLNHMLVLTATRGERAASVQNALSRAMATGKLQADGLETVLANGGEVASALAKELGVSTLQLRQMAADGKITGDVIANSLIKNLDDVRVRAAEMPATVSDAFTRVQTNFTAFVGVLDETTGASAAASGAILNMADSIGALAKNKDALDSLVTAGEILAVVLGARLVTAGLSAGASMSAVQIQAMRAAGGLTAMGVAASGAQGALALMGGPLGLAVTAVGLGVLAWQNYGKSARDNAGEGVLGLVDAKGSVNELVKGFEKLNSLQQTNLVAIKNEEIAKATKEASRAVFDLGNAFQPAMDKGTKAAAQYRSDFTSDIRAVTQDTSLSSDQMANKLAEVVKGYVDSGRASEQSQGKLLAMAQAAVSAAGDVGRLKSELDALAGAQRSVAQEADPAAANMQRWQANLKKFMGEYATPDERLKSAIEEQKQMLGELYSPEVESRLRNKILPKARSASGGESQAQKDAKAADQFVKKLQEQVFQIEKRTALESLYFDIQKKGVKLTDSQLGKVEALATMIDMAAEAEKIKTAEIDRQNTAYQLQERLIGAAQQYQGDLASYGQGDRAAKESADRIALQQKQQQELRDMTHQHGQEMRAAETESEREHLQSMFNQRMEMTQAAYGEEMMMYDEYIASKKEKEADWQLGFQEALQNFVDQSQDLYSLAEGQVSSLLGTMQSSISSNLMSMLDGTKSVSDGFSDMARSMGQAVVKALVDMAAQWLVYQGVQLLVGKTTQASAASAMTANAYAMATQAGLAAFASTAAIPIVGAFAAPAAMAAALAVTMPMATAVSGLALSGMAHDGIDSIPATGTWLLEKGERVTTANTSAKLDGVLERIDARQRSGAPAGGEMASSSPGVTVNLIGAPAETKVSQRQDQDGAWVIDVMLNDLQYGGPYSRAQSGVFGMTRRGS